ALDYARQRDLDLVEVAPEARPPVCRVLDYSKYKYEQEQKQKQARKHQQQITVREIKFRPKIAQHDYDTKKGHVERFLRNQDKVKVTIMFRGREVTHPERGEMILSRLADELAELAVIEQPQLVGDDLKAHVQLGVLVRHAVTRRVGELEDRLAHRMDVALELLERGPPCGLYRGEGVGRLGAGAPRLASLKTTRGGDDGG